MRFDGWMDLLQVDWSGEKHERHPLENEIKQNSLL